MNECMRYALTVAVSRGDKFMFLRKLMALPFLPAEHIRNAFDALHTQAADIGGPILKGMYNIYI